ncbi:PD-(D/E)XK nuclease family protein [Nibricoccus aquaticus]|uniref:PD-(D/E)XK nuclease family protein n=1 Tax=Nibricoccus aquaticus TaxID=2576891 RepID=UPI0010FE0680|nr:PD-(D/E)XK nuclease family protein [Nibricoccus aquaticus]
MESPRTELFLYRYAETAWRDAIRPWLEENRGVLQRSYVVVPTRGQAQALKQRCLLEGVALLGVEFLSPGLARKKWVALGAGAALKPALGRELLMLGLGVIVERRLKAMTVDAPERGLVRSLQSDLERALDDFDELLKAGFGPEDFELATLREIFAELVGWVDGLGYDFAPRQANAAAVAMQAADARAIGGRVLVHGFGPEMRGEFFNVATFARGFSDVTVIVPEPEFQGRKQAVAVDWAELWEKFLGVVPEPLVEEDAVESCEHAVAGWIGGEAVVAAEERHADAARVIVGLTRGDEMRLVAEEIVASLRGGAAGVGVIFPKADAAHFQLARLLAERGVAFVDQLGLSSPPPVEVKLARALLEFYEKGARLEELLTLWPLLKAVGRTELSLGEVRDVCERLFEEKQNHALGVYRENLDAGAVKRPAWAEVGKVATLLLPAWPSELTLAEALKRFSEVWAKLEQPKELLEGWGTLEAFAEKETRVLPGKVVFAAMKGFLPEKSPAAGGAGRNGFARVILTTRRRAEGLPWSHLIFVEANAGVWPERSEASCWLTDERRAELNKRARKGLGLFTSDERAHFEKQGVAALVRDTTERVVFSAALFDEQNAELKLAPNNCVERLLWAEALSGAKESGEKPGLEELFERCARATVAKTAGDPVETRWWLEIQRGRRDATRAFDEYFFSVDPVSGRPEKLAARLIERGIGDPAELWFAGVLGVKRVEWKPFVRARSKALGQLAHRVLAAVLRTPAVERVFGEMPTIDEAKAKLAAEMARLKAQRPADRYWESFHAELEAMCEILLEKVVALEAGKFVATEVNLPKGATIPVGADGARVTVYGRVDLVRIDRTDWVNARVDVVDFKTGKDDKLSAAKMGRDGSSLQLGIYLEAMRSVGAPHGRVHLLKPDAGDGGSLGMEELPEALACLAQLGRHLETGIYGALTEDFSEYSLFGCPWPLASAQVPEKILKEKFAVTFGVSAENAEGGDE